MNLDVASRPRWQLALVDLIAVLVFATLGRASHEEGLSLSGIVGTALPFLVGLAAGWALVGWRTGLRRIQQVGPGVTVWASTLVLGMIVRRIAGDGTAFSFILVAASFLALFLLGWRFLAGRFGADRGTPAA